ncbi:MAG: hypothetical protein EXR72_08525 [Myxococcales bacterium]|nr:hypothetical protein [Myxococcales bacterium]
MKRVLFGTFLASLVGCGATSLPGGDPAAGGENQLAARTCHTADKECIDDAECCAGSFCHNFTYARWQCVAAQIDGSYCRADRQCKGGSCRNYLCSSASCSAVGQGCHADGECCTGFCDDLAYGSHKCSEKLASGTDCRRNSHCQSGLCESYLCL